MRVNVDVFLQQLKITIDWTHHLSKDFDFVNGNYGTVFRSINPLVGGVEAFNIDEGYTTWNVDDYDISNHAILLEAALKIRNADVVTGISGRVLCFETCVTTHDCIAIVESGCFLDESEVPPIDTWFYLDDLVLRDEHAILYCWIPEGFEPVVKQGICVEIMGSYRWLDEVDPFLNKMVLDLLKS
jgi:hypothetical protein